VYGTFAARGNVNDPSTGINTTDKIDPFFYSVALPGGDLSPLAPSPGGAGTGSAGGAATGAGVAGAARVIGAALLDARFTGSATPRGDVALAAASLARAAPADTFERDASISSAGEKDVQALLQLHDATVDQVFAAYPRAEEGPGPGFFRPAHRALSRMDDWLVEALADRAFLDSE
jgi:hypothetical protein